MRACGMICLAAYTGWRRLGAAGAVAEEFFSSVGFNVGGYYGLLVAEIVFELVFNFGCD